MDANLSIPKSRESEQEKKNTKNKTDWHIAKNHRADILKNHLKYVQF